MRTQQLDSRNVPTVAHDLARQTGATVDEAKAVYEFELERLQSQARVQTYVPVIARKRAQATLERRQH